MNRTYPHSRPLIQILTLSCVLLLGSGRVLAETGLGVVLGWPAGIRYQQSLDIKRALFFDFAYQGDGYVIGSGHYSYSLFREEDRWRQDPRMGTLLYNIFAGITAGYRVETSREQKSLLGVKGGGALEYLFPHKRWSVRAEVAPVLFLSGTTAAGLQGGVVLMYRLEDKKTKPLQNLKSPAKKVNLHSVSP